MYIGHLKTQQEVTDLKARLSAAVEDSAATLKILNEMFQCDGIELLYHDRSDSVLKNIIDGNTIATEHLSKESILGDSFLSRKSFLVNNLPQDKRYNVALDNPYKTDISAQILLCIALNSEVLGIIRLSNNKKFAKVFIERIRLFSNSFKDIFLNSLYKKEQGVKQTAFNKNTTEVYLTLKKIKNLYAILSKHTEHPEVKKLIHEGNANIDTIFEYVNPNVDNITVVKKNLKKLRNLSEEDENKTKIRVLIADDVVMNVKILNAMLLDESIEDIQFAYDGIETVEKMIASYEDGELINVLFLDHHMPGKLGSEVAEMLRQKNMPLYIVSITNDPEAIEDKNNLYDYHLAKPFSKNAVVDTFSKIREKFDNR